MTETTSARSVEDKENDLLDDWSFEITVKDADRLPELIPLVPPGTLVSIALLPHDDIDKRVRAAAQVRSLGFEPVPHIAARQLRSEAELDNLLKRLKGEALVERVFVIGGDMSTALGPYEDALAVIRSGLLGQHGVRKVGIAGYPEGHPMIPNERLWSALLRKHEALSERAHECSILTQFSFDAIPVFPWLETLRARGMHVPVRIGVPGPTRVTTLLKFAARCGVGASAKVMAKYGSSITHLLGSTGPDLFVRDLANGLDPARHGRLRLHFFPFGGPVDCARWIRDFRNSRER